MNPPTRDTVVRIAINGREIGGWALHPALVKDAETGERGYSVTHLESGFKLPERYLPECGVDEETAELVVANLAHVDYMCGSDWWKNKAEGPWLGEQAVAAALDGVAL